LTPIGLNKKCGHRKNLLDFLDDGKNKKNVTNKNMEFKYYILSGT
jgi:hypothetical protein